MLRQSRTEEAQVLAKQVLVRGTSLRKMLYNEWRTKLDQLAVGGTLTVDEKGRLELDLSGTQMSDLSALGGMPLNRLDLASTRVTDLTPLGGMPLDWLSVHHTEVKD